MPTATKPATKKGATATKKAAPTPQNETATTSVTVAAPKSVIAKPTSAKPAPPATVAEYIATLSTDEQRYGRKAWRHATGQRGTAPSLRGITREQATSIRERMAELTR
jgi:hypothetical protein